MPTSLKVVFLALAYLVVAPAEGCSAAAVPEIQEGWGVGLSNSLPVKAIQIPDIFDLIYFSLCSMVPGLCIPGPMDIMDCNFVPGLILGIAYFM